MTQQLDCFKAYDIRGRVPEQLNADVAYRIGRAFAAYLQPSRVVVGFDIRLTSQELCAALSRGLTEGGADVTNIGQCGTEEIYFATSHLGYDGGIMVTASHNPADYNGMKFVREGSLPVSADTGLLAIKRLAELNEFTEPATRGSIDFADLRGAYLAKLLSFVDVEKLQPLKIVCNAGNGGAGATVDLLESLLPFELIRVHHEADGNFPNGVPNPMLEENRAPTTAAILEHKADLGIAWDGDFDRCFFFDENGRFIEGYYLVGLLAQVFLEAEPGAKIVHDPRLTWNTQEIVAGGRRHGHSERDRDMLT
jgi:phosphomannomutase